VKRPHPYRRPRSTLSIFGVSYLYKRNPYVVAWWSAAFPGFGHIMLNQYVRGVLLTLSEVIINTLANINSGMVYSFCGNFDMARSLIHPRWAIGYLLIYLFSIWDSYRSTLTQNKLCHLAEHENVRMTGFLLHPLGIQYVEQKKPYAAAICSFVFPGLGQLYNHRFALAFYAIFWWWFYISFSHVHESLVELLHGHLQQSNTILQPHWLMFMPSVLGGATYHAYATAVEHNQLFLVEQRQHLTDYYKNSNVQVFP
jgi:TM2 domain-containing membrane protein YozV